jgi:hypothetical protein
MSGAELLIPSPTVSPEALPQGGISDARSPSGGRSMGNGFVGASGTVEDQLSRLEVRLLAEVVGDRVAEQDVRRRLDAARARFAGAKVRRFLPILIERDVRRQLTDR